MLELTIRLIFSLAVVVGLLLIATKLGSRRFRGAKARRGPGVSIVHRQALSRTSSVAVVEVGHRLLVIGTTEHQVNLLTELAPGELEDIELAEIAATAEQPVEQPVAALPAPAPAAPEPAAPAAAVVDLGGRRRAAVSETPAEAPVQAPAAPVAGRRRADVPVAAPPAAASQPAEQPVLSAAETLAADAIDTTDFGQHLTAALAAVPTQQTAQPTPRQTAQPTVQQTPTAGRRRAVPPPTGDGPLAGSVLSPDTWRQALAATRRTG